VTPAKFGDEIPAAAIRSDVVKCQPLFASQYAALGVTPMLIFVFVLASGAIAYQPQSIENCLKLEAAFSNGDKITANIAGEDVPILHGKCVEVDSETFMRILKATPRRHIPSS
jgi:hypothetical protein